jgi:hypothetical protein
VHDQQSQILKKIQALLSSTDLIQKHLVPIAPTPPPAAMAHHNDPGSFPANACARLLHCVLGADSDTS